MKRIVFEVLLTMFLNLRKIDNPIVKSEISIQIATLLSEPPA